MIDEPSTIALHLRFLGEARPKGTSCCNCSISASRTRPADFTQTALDNVSVSFRDNEFVAILGPSGSGKTTLLNIVGGLDHYDSGNLVIDGISTERVQGPRLGRLPQQPHRLRVPKLQPHPPPDGALQRGAGAHAVGRVARRAARARGRGPEEGGPGRPREQEAEPALRRPDAARRHRPRPHQRSRDPAGRRAHRRARLQNQRPDHGPAHRDRERPPGHHGHAQPRARRSSTPRAS